MVDILKNTELKPYTTYKIGGPADFFATAYTEENLKYLVRYAYSNDIPFDIIGGGSNVLISDKGIRALVVKNNTKEIIIREDVNVNNFDIKNLKSFYKEGSYMQFEDLEDNESEYKKILVEVSSGLSLAYLINDTISKGLTGLQYFAGIPGTLGGAIFNNIHGGTRLIGNLLHSAKVIDMEGNVSEVDYDFFKFGYDTSVLHQKQYTLLSLKLILFEGDTEKAKTIQKEWIKRKHKIQPTLPSCGSVFKNISDEEKQEIGAPVNSAGWVIEQLGFKGFKIGGAEVYKNHANFIVNLGFAKASDVKTIIDKIKGEALKKFNLKLTPEIILKGDF